MFLGCRFHYSPHFSCTLYRNRLPDSSTQLGFGLGVVGVALLVFCLVAVGFVFFCCVFLPGRIAGIAA